MTAWVTPAKSRGTGFRAWDWKQTGQIPVRLVRAAGTPGGVVIAGTLMAFHSSLASLIGSIGSSGAGLMLAVGLLSVLVVAASRLRSGLAPPIHDSAIDHTLGRAYGLGFLALAGILILLSPNLPAGGGVVAHVNPYVSLAWAPFFAGLVALAYGMRGVKTLRTPIGLIAILGVGQLMVPADLAMTGSALSPAAVSSLSAAWLYRSRRLAVMTRKDDGSVSAADRSWPEARRHRSAAIGLLAALIFGLLI
jgi:hypothetical protein